MKKKFFISYRALDSALADAVATCVKSVGAEFYLDRRDPTLDSITVGATERQQSSASSIQAGLQSADALVAVITRRARGSWWVPFEISAALQMGKEVVALCETDVRPPDFVVHYLIQDRKQLCHWLATVGEASPDQASLDQVASGLFGKSPDGLRWASQNAIEKIEALWDRTAYKQLALEDPGYAHRRKWMGCRSDRLTSTLYAIAAPVYMYQRSVRLDRSELERIVASMLYESWIDEESLAVAPPQLAYEARRCTDWRNLRDHDPRRYWLQGMKPKDLDDLFDEISSEDGGILTEKAVSALYLSRYEGSGAAQRPLGLAANALQGFTPETRPVFARVMAVHLRLHYALLKLDAAGGVGQRPAMALFELPPSSTLHGTDLEAVSTGYIASQLGQKLDELMPNVVN